MDLEVVVAREAGFVDNASFSRSSNQARKTGNGHVLTCQKEFTVMRTGERTMEIRRKDQRIGFAGQVASERMKTIGPTHPVFFAELNLDSFAELGGEQTFREIPRDIIHECIVVDDFSADSTVEVARQLGLRVFLHGENQGYGGNQKTCYIEALNMGVRVMDSTAITMGMDNNLPIIVLNLWEPGSLERALLGEPVGTVVDAGVPV